MGRIILKLDVVMADRHMSLNELAERIGISNVNLSKIKNNKVTAVRFSTLAGICEALNCDFALSATGIAGPDGGTPAIPVGTIWLGYGSKDEVKTYKLTEDDGRDLNLSHATNQVLKLFLEYLKSHL